MANVKIRTPSHISWPEIAPERERQLRDFLSSVALKPKALHFFDQALTHSSCAFENNLPGDNERLEFLGDSILGTIVSEWLYDTLPEAQEGELSKLKAAMVSRGALGARAKELGVPELLRLGRGQSGASARARSSIFGSALEALVGAASLEMGPAATRRFVVKRIVEPIHAGLELDGMQDHKTTLQEWTQKEMRTTPTYRVVEASGPDHDKRFVVEVFIKGESHGQGNGRRKKDAENDAARSALELLRKRLSAEAVEE